MAWHAGHKKTCKDRLRLYGKLFDLQAANDWNGVCECQDEALALAGTVEAFNPLMSGKIKALVAIGLLMLGSFDRARALQEEYWVVCEACGDRAGAASATANIATVHFYKGEYTRARQLYEVHRSMCKALGDCAGVANACSKMGVCDYRVDNYESAIKLFKLDKAMSETLSDSRGIARACKHLGQCYSSTGGYNLALTLHENEKTIYEALGDEEGVATALSNIGMCKYSQCEFEKAHELQEEHRAMCEKRGDVRGLALAYSNLGLCCFSRGRCTEAMEMHEKSLKIGEDIGDEQGVSISCRNLGSCYMNLKEYEKSFQFYERAYKITTQMNLSRMDAHNITTQMNLSKMDAHACFGMGIALRMQMLSTFRNNEHGGPEIADSGDPSLICGLEQVQTAKKWLVMARDFGLNLAHLELARLALDCGLEDDAVQHAKIYVDLRVKNSRNQCESCHQIRYADAQMLLCGGCRVARFCNVDHQKLASNALGTGGSFMYGRHKDVCALLGKWRRQVVKRGESPDVLRNDILAYLRKRICASDLA